MNSDNQEEANTHNDSHIVNLTKLSTHINMTDEERILESILTNEVDGNGVHIENVHNHSTDDVEITTEPMQNIDDNQNELSNAITERSSLITVLCVWCN